MNESTASLMGLANRTLKDAQLLIDQTGYRSAISRSYYAMFYTAEAAFLTHDIVVKSHAGAINQFSQQFVETGKIA